MPARNATVRLRGTGLAGCAAFTRRTAHSHHPTAMATPSVGSGSNVQPNSSDPAVGGSTGTGPWAATGPARIAHPVTAARPAIDRWIQ